MHLAVTVLEFNRWGVDSLPTPLFLKKKGCENMLNGIVSILFIVYLVICIKDKLGGRK